MIETMIVIELEEEVLLHLFSRTFYISSSFRCLGNMTSGDYSKGNPLSHYSVRAFFHYFTAKISVIPTPLLLFGSAPKTRVFFVPRTPVTC